MAAACGAARLAGGQVQKCARALAPCDGGGGGQRQISVILCERALATLAFERANFQVITLARAACFRPLVVVRYFRLVVTQEKNNRGCGPPRTHANYAAE